MTEVKAYPKTGCLYSALFIVASLAFIFWIGGYHIVWSPTEDQLYGCNVENEAPNGECK